jgi:hypothetical protein
VVSREENVDFVICNLKKLLIWVRSFTKVVKFIKIDSVLRHFMKSSFMERKNLSTTLTRKTLYFKQDPTIYFVSRIKINDNFNNAVKVKWKDHD